MIKKVVICDICGKEINADDKVYAHVTTAFFRSIGSEWRHDQQGECYDMHYECLDKLIHTVKE